MAKTGKIKKRENDNFPLLDALVGNSQTIENSVCTNFFDKLQNDYNYELDQIAVNVENTEFKIGAKCNRRVVSSSLTCGANI